MQEKDDQKGAFHTDANADSNSNDMGNKNQGPQGVDKAPGEEAAEDPHKFVEITQRGKKVDADPSKPSGQPIEENM